MRSQSDLEEREAATKTPEKLTISRYGTGMEAVRVPINYSNSSNGFSAPKLLVYEKMPVTTFEQMQADLFVMGQNVEPPKPKETKSADYLLRKVVKKALEPVFKAEEKPIQKFRKLPVELGSIHYLTNSRTKKELEERGVVFKRFPIGGHNAYQVVEMPEGRIEDDAEFVYPVDINHDIEDDMQPTIELGGFFAQRAAHY